MESMAAYIPMDRRQALAKGEGLSNRTSGTVLFADISGYTPLTRALMEQLGRKRGAEILTAQINQLFERLIATAHYYRGSIISFEGDAITCWFDGDNGSRGTACALGMQQTMKQFARLDILPDLPLSLAIKVAVAAGPARRFQIGDPQIRLLDVIAGATLETMARGGKQAKNGEVVVGPEIVSSLQDRIELVGWRSDDRDKKFAVVSALASPIETAPWPTLPQTLDEADLRARLLPPVYERLKSGQDQFLGEFRWVNALFLKFGGIAYDDDDRAEEKLDRYICLVQRVLAQYQGYLIKLTIGDKGNYLLATFGAPLAHDGDEANAVAAALELQSPLMQPPFINGVQIGLSQGWMLTGAFGSDNRRAYDVLGNEANIAARLMSQAQPGQLLVSQRIVEATAPHFHFEGPTLIKLKGSDKPLPFFLAVRRKNPSATIPPASSPGLVGRDHELSHLEAILPQVVAGQGQIVRLAGPAGIGKSRLVAELAARAGERGLRVAIGACQSAGQHLSYFPWRQVFRHLFELTAEPLNGQERAGWLAGQIERLADALTSLNPDWQLRLPLLGDLLNLPLEENETTAALDPKQRRELLLQLLIEIIQTWAERQPLLLLIEDAQWLDELSTALLLTLSRVLAEKPVLLLIVHRPAGPDSQSTWSEFDRLPNHHLLELTELSLAGVKELATQRLGRQAAPLLVSFLQTQTRGNPFFIEESLNALRESGHVRYADKRWTLSEAIIKRLRQAKCLSRVAGEWELKPDTSLQALELDIPGSIYSLLRARLDRLPETDRLTLNVAGVIGDVFEFKLLAQSHPALANEEILYQQLQRLEGQDFIRLETPYPYLTYRFKHQITREVTYQTLLAEQQCCLHRQVGRALEKLRDDDVERLTFHYSHTEEYQKTLRYLDQAAAKAQGEYANEAARRYFEQALDLEAKLGQRQWQRRKGLVEVLHILGERQAETAALQALAAHEAAPAFVVAYLWGQYYEAIGEYAQAQTAIEQALAISRQMGHLVDEVRCLAQLGLIARRQGHYETAKEWYAQAVTRYREQADDQPEIALVFIETLTGLGTVHRQQSAYDQAQTCYQQALALSRQSGNKRGEAEALNSLGVIAFYQRNFNEALSYHQQTLSIWQTIGDRAGEGNSLTNLAIVTRDAGDYSQAQKYLNEALKIQQATANRWEEVNIWIDLGGLYYELGEMITAQSCLEQGLRLSREIEDEAGEAFVLCNLGLVLGELGQLTAAETTLRQGLPLAQAQTDKYLAASFYLYLSLVSLQAGKPQQAIPEAQAALNLRRELGRDLRIADDLTSLAEAYLIMGQLTAAMDYVQRTLEVLADCGGEGSEFPQRSYFISYQVLAAAGQPDQAQTALQAAYDLVMNRADKITDPTQRYSFLEGRTMNREIVVEYEKLRGHVADCVGRNTTTD